MFDNNTLSTGKKLDKSILSILPLILPLKALDSCHFSITDW
jgi:hypothetical protein